MPPVDMIRLVKMQVYEKLSRVQADVEAATVGIPPDEVAELEDQLRTLEEANRGLEERLTREQRRVEALERELEKMQVTIAMQNPLPLREPQHCTGLSSTVLSSTVRGTPEEEPGPGNENKADEKKTRPPGIWIIGETTAEANPDLEAEAQELLKTQALDEVLRNLIELLGEGTVCRRTEVRRTLEERGVGRGGTIKRRVKRAIEENLIEVVKPKAEISGRATDLLRLTPLGLAAARVILNRDPAKPLLDRLMARHKSLEHTLLNLEAADLLRAIGGTVNLFPLAVKLPNGGTLDVDLLWRYEGQTRYVECERDTYKNRRQRQDKWHNLYQVTKDFWIAVPNPSAQKRLQSELVNWAVSDGYRFNLHLTNLARATVGNPWLYERRTGLPSAENDRARSPRVGGRRRS